MGNPFFSIVVVSLNAGRLMGETMDSIVRQTFTDYEVVVKDGLSGDDTLTYVPARGNIHVYAQKDGSIYEAMNQATEKTTGKYLIYMNCGDIFSDGQVLEQVHDAIGDRDFGMVYGNYTRAGQASYQPQNLTGGYLYRRPICHQSVFFSGALLRAGAPYDTRYRICADYDLELRTFFSGHPALHCDVFVCDYAPGGVSESEKGERLKKGERAAIVKQNFPAKDRFCYELKFRLTLPGLRKKLTASEKTPQWIRRLFQRAANHVNR